MSTPRSARAEPVDSELLLQLASLPRGAQHWLKTALLAIERLEDSNREAGAAVESPPARRPERRRPAPGLDEMISGGASLEEQIEAYPELAEELRGLNDIANLLREGGRRHRQMGEDILRGSDGEQEPDEEEDEGEAGADSGSRQG